MRIFQDLLWYFKEEKRSYGFGVLFLFFVSLINLIPPYITWKVVDGIKDRSMGSQELIIWLSIIVLLAGLVYGCRYVWRVFLFGAVLMT
ncbi:hypothetical protein PP175_24635 [Aneurinibacillus sp. Ricciae_BoGa-3]|uniref:hypothetical protein n=1 Tax=Aneurinibacillus sp. Ricciae_BoGa-3 TaxID=3022697 RepID=UPI00233FCB61|nr:hypothetical protein [Aneurinibacillus sp. Ricciae_BoGa-3]WCK54426.1 hypothetical protein PP175_24635 [Aneurinibacillus sp. Ricciae_BoGa-3]